MERKSRRPGEGSGSECQTAADVSEPIAKDPEQQFSGRKPRIVLHSWGTRTVVTVEPRRVNRPSQPFRTEADARAFAEKLQHSEGWPIEERRQ